MTADRILDDEIPRHRKSHKGRKHFRILIRKRDGMRGGRFVRCLPIVKGDWRRYWVPYATERGRDDALRELQRRSEQGQIFWRRFEFRRSEP